MLRREFLAGSSTVLGAALGHRQTPALTVDGKRLRQRLEALSVFGRPAGGSFADGVSRVAFSEADVAARTFVLEEMKALGLSPRIDAAGNLRGRREGRRADQPPLLFGSHIDSVRGGGNYDGDVGSMGALEVVAVLDERRIGTDHPLEVVIWAAEESSYGAGLFGSRMAAEGPAPGEFTRVEGGVSKAEALRRIGGDPDRIAEARRAKGSFHAYLELHVEQGGRLDRAGIPIGVVEGIVTIDDYDVSVTGFANHAGTTPMDGRQDALVAAAQLVLAVREIATAQPGAQVGTVGQVSVHPGAPNVVPGRVELTVEFRDLSGETVARLGEELKRRAAEIAERNRCAVDVVLTSRHEGARTAETVRTAIEQSAAELGLRYLRLPSGAGHDAQMMARLGPIGMIFVPSLGGVSHSPKEASRFEDCAQGASVLLHTLLALDAVPRIH